MNNTSADYENNVGPEMRAEYDLAGGRRGWYAHLFSKTVRAVVPAPDVAAVLPDADAVNEALRMLVKAARQSMA